jgi:hypothetical protein
MWQGYWYERQRNEDRIFTFPDKAERPRTESRIYRTRIGSNRPRHGKFIDFGSHSNLVIKQS